MNNWFDEQYEDAIDFAKEQLDWAWILVGSIVKPALKQLVKSLRLKWQAHANEIVNDIEDETVEEIKVNFPAIPEADIRKIYWQVINKAQGKIGIDWLKDV